MSRFNFHRPIVFFDLETTGTNLSKDRIVEIYAKKIGHGKEEEFYQRINPNMQVPYEVAKIHGLTNEILAFEPYFEDVAHSILDFFKGCDVGGYNIIRFDLPILIEEFLRIGVENPFTKSNVVDSMFIFHKMMPRNLAGALRYYKNEELKNAHSAKADVLATIEVFLAQTERHQELPKTAEDLENFVLDGKEIVDYTRYFSKNTNGDIIFNFGKHKNKVAKMEEGYLKWMINNDFPLQTKRIIQQILNNKL